MMCCIEMAVSALLACLTKLTSIEMAGLSVESTIIVWNLRYTGLVPIQHIIYTLDSIIYVHVYLSLSPGMESSTYDVCTDVGTSREQCNMSGHL